MNANRPKVLFFSPCTPDNRGTGWEQRAFSTLSAYSNYVDVELWFKPTDDNPDLIRVSRLATLCKSIIAFHPAMLKTDAVLRGRLERSLSSAQCVHVFRSLEMLSLIEHRCIFWDIDEVPWVLRDPSRNASIEINSSAQKEELFEQFSKAWRKSKRVFSCSPLESCSALGEVTVLPNAYSNIEILRPRTPTSDLLFVGNMNYFPNLDAVIYFAEAILPLLPTPVKLHVAGRSPSTTDSRAILDQLGRNPRVRFSYDVECCSPCYHDAAMAIVPLRFGGGTRIKILEAFAHGCPVVSTTKGCEGLSVRDGVELLVKDEPAAFAQACKSILDEPSIGGMLSEKAHELILHEHSQEVVARRLHSSLIGASLL